MAKLRRTVSFDEDLVDAIEEYRRRSARIPSFNSAVVELVKKGLRK